MKFAPLRCCINPIFLRQYESSTNAILDRFGIEFVDIKEFNCCGYPFKNFNFKTYVLSSARNLALAEKRNLNVLTVCSCCYGSLRHVDHVMKNDPSLREEVNVILGKEGLRYRGEIEIKHLLQVLYHDIGVENIRKKLLKTFSGLKIATHYGCHLLRPSNIVQFDRPLSPSIFDQLVELTGAESISWLTKHECCGAPLWGINDELSMDLTEKKLMDAKQSGADCLCVVCPYCQLQFDRIQTTLLSKRSGQYQLPSILYPQLLGLCLGIDGEILGLEMNQVSLGRIGNWSHPPGP